MDINKAIGLKLTHSIHTSERKSFRGCRRRWSWVFRDYYYPTVTAKPLEFGVAFHKAMETYSNPLTWHDRGTAAALAKVVFKRVTEEQRDKYKLDHPELWNDEAKADYEERVELGLAMLEYYFEHEAPKWDREFTPVKVEVKFEVPITNPDTGEQLYCKCDDCVRRWVAYQKTLAQWDENYILNVVMRDWAGLPVTYGGRLDRLDEDRNGAYWVVDWKTAARLATGEPGADDDFLLWDDQITSYVWALWRLGLNVKGFIYAEFKKALIAAPEPNKTKRMGRWYSVNKQIACTPELYEKTVKENDVEAYEAGLYDEFIEYLKSEGDRFHKRHQITRNEQELIEAGRNIYLEALEMTNQNLAIYPSPGRFGCGTCAFAQPCLGKNRGEDYLYTLASLYEKRRYHYWEDKEPSTESKGAE